MPSKTKDTPPRPPNAFLCFRAEYIKQEKARNDGHTQTDWSKLAGQQWRAMSPADKKKYQDMAARKKAEHQIQFPGYKYAPGKRGLENRLRNGRGSRKSHSATAAATTTVPLSGRARGSKTNGKRRTTRLRLPSSSSASAPQHLAAPQECASPSPTAYSSSSDESMSSDDCSRTSSSSATAASAASPVHERDPEQFSSSPCRAGLAPSSLSAQPSSSLEPTSGPVLHMPVPQPLNSSLFQCTTFEDDAGAEEHLPTAGFAHLLDFGFAPGGAEPDFPNWWASQPDPSSGWGTLLPTDGYDEFYGPF
ncbi:HMG box domain-containing protein [Mycena chlorophos]|uniref:HMG box domain-containing protein n=1 Tax=Mycena chlorophos TaxID=658473 RepID=A0A8H6WG06_MYCCL|nr:HMG box domain-containing protein [Mycena chlorophos]